MKKIAFVFSMILFMVISSQAYSQFRIGLKGGINASEFSGINQTIFTENVTGYHAGVFMRVGLLGFSIQPEALFNSKGGATATHRFNLEYVDFPLLLSFNMLRFFNIHVGPYLSVLTNAEAIDITATNGTNTILPDINRHSFRDHDWGISAGAGIDISRISLGVRYNRGLTNVTDDPALGNNNIEINNARNSVWQFFLGFTLN
jgi:hypothetical protein